MSDCPHCCSLVVATWLNESNEDGPSILAWRCIACGWVGDEVVRQRYMQRMAATVGGEG